MRLHRVLAALSLPLAAIAGAQNFSSYLPDCAPPCVEQTVTTAGLCGGLEDAQCLCTKFGPILGSSRACFIQSCNSIDPFSLRSEIFAGWTKFCNDSGIEANLPSGWDVGGPPNFPSFTMTSDTSSTSTPSTSTTPTPSSTTITTPAPSSTTITIPMKATGLSTGAKAGIGIGVGIGALAAIGGLVFFGFRLGRKRRRSSGNGEAEGISPNSGDVDTEGVAGETLPTVTDTTATKTPIDTRGDHSINKTQSKDGALFELPSLQSPRSELPAHGIGELPVAERPVELWHGVMPPELSADAEVPRGGIARWEGGQYTQN